MKSAQLLQRTVSSMAFMYGYWLSVERREKQGHGFCTGFNRGAASTLKNELHGVLRDAKPLRRLAGEQIRKGLQ